MCEACYGSCPNCRPDLYPSPQPCNTCDGEGYIYYECLPEKEEMRPVDIQRWKTLPINLRDREECPHCHSEGYIYP